ncbi:MAG TPA: hypothetical protein VFS08_06525 [Gemmatimonadaceae bacterium]|nr:hypothetical protein [Gemmatimonadaceae bacterium]
MNPRSLIALAGLTLLATACGGSDKKSPTEPGGENDNSSYSASISGGYTKSLTGTSAFASDNSQTEVGFALALGTEEGNNNAIVIWRRQSGVLAAGTYQFADYSNIEDPADVPANELVGITVFDLTQESAVLCVSTSGTLTITQSSANRLKGNVSMAASCLDSSGAEKTINVTGTFDAVGGTVVIPNG